MRGVNAAGHIPESMNFPVSSISGYYSYPSIPEPSGNRLRMAAAQQREGDCDNCSDKRTPLVSGGTAQDGAQARAQRGVTSICSNKKAISTCDETIYLLQFNLSVQEAFMVSLYWSISH